MPKGVPLVLPPDVVARAKALNDAGLCDREVAERMADVLPRGRPGHMVVLRIRRRFGWPLYPDTESRRRSIANQRKRLGITAPWQLQTLAYRRFAERSGWPTDLPPRAVQILNVLAARGPQTGLQLAEAIGMRTDKRNPVHGGPVLLDCSASSRLCRGHRTYTALLRARGLIAVWKPRKGRGTGGEPNTYALTATAVATRRSLLDERQQAEARAGRAAPPDAGG